MCTSTMYICMYLYVLCVYIDQCQSSTTYQGVLCTRLVQQCATLLYSCEYLVPCTLYPCTRCTQYRGTRQQLPCTRYKYIVQVPCRQQQLHCSATLYDVHITLYGESRREVPARRRDSSLLCDHGRTCACASCVQQTCVAVACVYYVLSTYVRVTCTGRSSLCIISGHRNTRVLSTGNAKKM